MAPAPMDEEGQRGPGPRRAENPLGAACSPYVAADGPAGSPRRWPKWLLAAAGRAGP